MCSSDRMPAGMQAQHLAAYILGKHIMGGLKSSSLDADSAVQLLPGVKTRVGSCVCCGRIMQRLPGHMLKATGTPQFCDYTNASALLHSVHMCIELLLAFCEGITTQSGVMSHYAKACFVKIRAHVQQQPDARLSLCSGWQAEAMAELHTYSPTACDVVCFGHRQRAPISLDSQPFPLVLHNIKLIGDSSRCAKTEAKAGCPSITHPDIVNSKIFACFAERGFTAQDKPWPMQA